MPAIDTFPIQLLMTIAALALVLALAWLLLKMLAAGGVAKSRSGRLRIRDTIALGTRERLVVVEHDNHEYLIGVASGAVTLLEKKPVASTNPGPQ